MTLFTQGTKLVIVRIITRMTETTGLVQLDTIDSRCRVAVIAM